MPKKKEDNLIPVRSKNEARERGRIGGIASGKARREKKALRETLEDLLKRDLKDKELLDIGLEQLYWTVGKNPFGQSLIYGEGHNYPQLNTFSSGEMTGEMPVGIHTLGNDDVPYWPQTNNACYKEVWITSAGKWLSLIAEY